VAAASDLTSALPALITRFTEKTKIEVTPIFNASGQLSEQIKAGAPFDVFLAANQTFVKKLADGKFVRPESVQPYAVGSLVLVVRRESAGDVKSLDDLAKPEIKKIALANPAIAPYGAAGKQALERSGLWGKVESKIVQSESVRQALKYVQTGNTEAGLVGRAIANVPEVTAITVDAKLYDPIVQGLAIVSATQNAEAAEAFTKFVLSDDGQAVLAEFGFAKPDASSESSGEKK
jgi:molybdate transport system substrate-binding protein